MLSPIRKNCAHPGCRMLVVKGRCAQHTKEVFVGHKESAAKRGYGRQHQKWRLMVLAADPVCRICGRAEATEADHIVPISKGGARFALENGQGVCKSCHAVKTRGDNAA